MSSWKFKFKSVGKVFTILRKRSDTDGGETSRIKANSLAGHDYSDISRTPTGPAVPLALGSKPAPRKDNLQSDTSSSFGVGTSSADDSADVQQRPGYELLVPY